jgi:steroid delta-isomerase-like uncharacterized protein
MRLTSEAILRRAADHFGDPGSRARYLELYDEAAVVHGYPGVEPGIASIRKFYDAFWAAFPDARLEIEDTVEDHDRLAARFVVHATHRGEFLGVPATGRAVALTGITILRFRDGRCVERWSEANFLSLLRQLGAIS